jgi:hypothetical protein
VPEELYSQGLAAAHDGEGLALLLCQVALVDEARDHMACSTHIHRCSGQWHLIASMNSRGETALYRVTVLLVTAAGSADIVV